MTIHPEMSTDALGDRTAAAPGPWPALMDNPIRNYEWGSTTTLARLQGRPPSGLPEAELWMGAHPSSPSRLLPPPGDEGGPGIGVAGLDDLIASRPLDILGARVHDRFGARLPFMLKILAIAQPLSVQVHPTGARARSAFAGEADVPGEHVYVDPYPKPEMLYALEPIDAMCGFRSADEARRLLALIGGARMAEIASTLDGDDSEEERIEAAFERLVTWSADDRADLATEVGAASRRLLAGAGPQLAGRIPAADRRALTWASRLAVQHPKDPLVAAPFLLDVVQLQPGETLFVPAGAPHCYLAGLGVEILGNSDNVLRAGLTHKTIAVEELLNIVHGGTRPQRDIPETWVSPNEVLWAPGVAEFRLSRVWLHDQAPVAAYPHVAGPQVVLCTAGGVRVECGGHDVYLTPGQSAFIGATGGPVTLTGVGEVFRAFTGDVG
ncbi:MAG TPA: mannose-6-phosphate isomerase, class I [Kineosporiaceae bacterium]